MGRNQMKVGYFSDLCNPVNALLDRRVEGITVSALNKVFPNPEDRNAFLVNYAKKTLNGQKFKFSAKVQPNKEGVAVTTGKFAAEPIYRSADLGIETAFAIAKKDNRTTIEFSEKYTAIKDVVLGLDLKVDKKQTVAVSAKYNNNTVTGSLKITKGLDWKLFSKFETEASSDLDINATFLTGFGLVKEYVAGAEFNAKVADAFVAKDLTLVGGYKAADWQGVAFARLDLVPRMLKMLLTSTPTLEETFTGKLKRILNSLEVVVSPLTKDASAVGFDYTVGACIPFGPNGLTQFRFGLDGKLGAAFTQWVNPRVLFSIGSAFDTADLTKSSFAFTLTLEA